MKLKEFIKELKKIERKVIKPERINVQMADCIPVVKPIFKNNTVFITDVSPRGRKKKE
ncbi:MAG: hypothetical protein NZM02_02815 [Patescibacteria group bacterium]|nr:hypothetical protein [Patescibacteria group bacterium]